MDISFFDGKNYWNPDRSGDYTDRVERGRGYAAELIRHIVNTGETFMLGYVLAAMMAAGEWRAVEIGFASGLAGELR